MPKKLSTPKKEDICPNCGTACFATDVLCPNCGKNLDELFEQLPASEAPVGQSRNSSRLIILISILYFIGILPAVWCWLILGTFAHDGGPSPEADSQAYYFFGIPLLLAISAIAALAAKRAGRLNLAWALIAIPIVYLCLYPVMPALLTPFSPRAHLPDRYIDRIVPASELAGRWTITPDSRQRLTDRLEAFPDSGSRAPWEQIILDPDGSCQGQLEANWIYILKSTFFLTNVPEQVSDIRSNNFLECTWELTAWMQNPAGEPVQGVVVIFLYPSESRLAYELYLFEDQSGLILWAFIGDELDSVTQEYRQTVQ